jgi:hypothetical protein
MIERERQSGQNLAGLSRLLWCFGEKFSRKTSIYLRKFSRVADCAAAPEIKPE